MVGLWFLKPDSSGLTDEWNQRKRRELKFDCVEEVGNSDYEVKIGGL